jgi:hypothetical protein
MNNLQKVVLCLLIALVLIFGGGWVVDGILNLAALASPQLVSKMECPAGATAKQELVQQSFAQPGQKTLTFRCLDQTGNRVPPLSDAQTKALEFSYFYPRGIISAIILMAAWFIWSAIRGRMKV